MAYCLLPIVLSYLSSCPPKTQNLQKSVLAWIGSPRELRPFEQMGSKRNPGANPMPHNNARRSRYRADYYTQLLDKAPKY